ncbi:hypothetical protein B0I33_103281 [Prauserella shujinwangii]|uniref:DUF3558 domain-containing protein n=1 Tax=Prauserella shujinwangii TaxID=1453103 RepID=A0A2T0LYQ8_9PSEU|nr:hypothetical protein B0I33_103281 [Prauserella shujinwangii]
MLLGVVAGCSGPDLTRAHFPRTTVTAAPGDGGQGEVPTGPITDPAVSAAALRTVDPCALLGGDTAGVLGEAGTPEPGDWGVCTVEVRDAGGKPVGLRLDLGESLVLADRATGGIEGLPLVENEVDEGSCFVTAVTSRDPSLGITVQVDYEAGDPCAAGYSVLRQVLAGLRGDPGTYPPEPGSLLGVDPCATVTDDVLAEVLPGEVRKRPMGLHQCRFAGHRPSAVVWFRTGYPPDADAGTPVDLGGGVRAVRQRGQTDTVECDISWQHRSSGEGPEGENVTASFTFASEEGSVDDACARALAVARDVVRRLPSS